MLLQAFVMHDVTGSLFQKIMRSFLSTFPNMKMFIYVDSFAPEDPSSMQLPGFDYIHSLLNIKTRTKEETVEILKKTGFLIQKEFQIPDLPNCYVLVLSPLNGLK